MHLYTLQIKLQILVPAACSSVIFAFPVPCFEGICSKVTCRPANELQCDTNKMVVTNASECGCCEGCIKMMIITIIMDVFSTKTISLNDLWCCALWLTIVLF
jgi:hypothetical protein